MPTKPSHSIKNPLEDAKKRLFMDIMMPMDDVSNYLDLLSLNPKKARIVNKIIFSLLSKDKQKLDNDENLDKLVLAKQRLSDWTESHGAPSLDYIAMLCRYWGILITDLCNILFQCSDIVSILDRYVVGQYQYKKALALTACSYLRNLRKTRLRNEPIDCSMKAYNNLPDPMSPEDEMLSSSNSFRNTLLVWGPSGSGKTYCVTVLCKYLGLPTLIIHCNNLVQSGFWGVTIEDYFSAAYNKYGDMTRYMVVIFDEFDKIFSNKEFGIEISDEILNITDSNGSIKVHKSESKLNECITIPTDNMMFVFCGCFSKLNNQVRGVKKIGYPGSQITSTRSATKVGSEDFINFGLSNELIGRIQNFTFVDALTESDILYLLNSAASPFLKYKNVLHDYGYEVELTEDGKSTLAFEVIRKGLGVRGLETVLKKILEDKLYVTSPSPGTSICIDTQYINNCISNN